MNNLNDHTSFNDLGLSKEMLRAVARVGYETPSPIQAGIIPKLISGQDVIGQAQTGTGKTAAFAFPLLSQLDLSARTPQILVLTPTRELAIQVAEAFQTYAAELPGFRVLPVYGGQDIRIQLKHLKRGAHVIIGTPGRLIDHLKRSTISLKDIKSIVLDEADEMLRMGFVEEVEKILKKTPVEKQVALFSATMPKQIRRIAETYLKNPEHVTIQLKTTTAETVRQRYWLVKGVHKLDALTRILETEDYQAVLIFVRTKTATLELTDKLRARGHAAEALNGDIRQSQREKIIERLRDGSLDIVVATDVAARGIDVTRITHVINYDIPYDNESYVHRIGRTGRAGRSGEAILFVTPREKRMLRGIEQSTNQKIEEMELPTIHNVNEKRMEEFKSKISETIKSKCYEPYLSIIETYQDENETPALELAAALAHLAHENTPLLLGKSDSNITHDASDEHRGERAPRRGKHKGKKPWEKSKGKPRSRGKFKKSPGSKAKPGSKSGSKSNNKSAKRAVG